MDVDYEVKRFVDFMRKYGNENLVYGEGCLISQGCNGDHGCCAETLDLCSLADDLAELAGIDS